MNLNSKAFHCKVIRRRGGNSLENGLQKNVQLLLRFHVALRHLWGYGLHFLGGDYL